MIEYLIKLSLMIEYLIKLSLIIVVLTSQQVFSRCPPNNYYDVHTDKCHPCSDCDYPRTPNQFCVKDCPAVGPRCEAGKYFDEHTQNCHLCTECKPPLTPNEFCQAQCTDDERNGRSSAPVTTPGMIPSTGPSLERIIIIVVCTIMGAVVLVLVILAVLYRKQCLCKDKQRHHAQVAGAEHREPFISTNNGPHSVNIEMQSLPTSRTDELQQTNKRNFSLPIHVPPHPDSSANHCTNNQNNFLQDGGEDSVELVDDRDRTASHGTSHSSVEASTRLQHSLSHQDRSLKGNVVCQPENEEQDRCQFLPSVCLRAGDAGAVHGMLSPSSTRDAEPHLSFDPNKNCGYEDHIYPNSSSTPNGFDMQTSLKSSC